MLLFHFLGIEIWTMQLLYTDRLNWQQKVVLWMWRKKVRCDDNAHCEMTDLSTLTDFSDSFFWVSYAFNISCYSRPLRDMLPINKLVCFMAVLDSQTFLINVTNLNSSNLQFSKHLFVYISALCLLNNFEEFDKNTACSGIVKIHVHPYGGLV